MLVDAFSIFEPVPVITGMMMTAMPAAMSPYSMAVAAFSSWNENLTHDRLSRHALKLGTMSDQILKTLEQREARCNEEFELPLAERKAHRSCVQRVPGGLV